MHPSGSVLTHPSFLSGLPSPATVKVAPVLAAPNAASALR